jgi:DNA polymerase-4
MMPTTGERKIIHIDMDAFFASIEQRDEPKFRGRPVIVGGNPWERGVVSTCSYEARRYGIRSAMPSKMAVKLCPHAVFLPVRMEHYMEVSQEIFAIFHGYSDLVEPLSVDEAFLDVTENRLADPSATRLARHILDRIRRDVHLTASAGVSFNPFLAKVASGMKKPNGMTIIPPERALAFIDTLPIRKFYGIGPVTASRLEALQLFSGADLRALPLEDFLKIFGKTGHYYHGVVWGKDPRPIVCHRERQSLGRETTFAEDLLYWDDMCEELRTLSRIVSMELQNENLRGRTVTLKVRYGNFSCITRSMTLPVAVGGEEEIFTIAREMLQNRTAVPVQRVRLLGVSVSGFSTPARGASRWVQQEFDFARTLPNR